MTTEPRYANRRPALPALPKRRQVADCPEPGFRRLRLVRGGPWVPAVIWLPCPMIEPPSSAVEDWPVPEDWCTPLDRCPNPMRCQVGDDPWSDDPLEVLRVWQSGWPCSAAEYAHMMAVRAWAARHAPYAPEANPHRPIDLNQQPSLF